MKVTYYSDKEKGIITAVLELTPEERNETSYIVNNTNSLWISKHYNMSLHRTYSAVVKLQEGDTWDEDYGKMLARRKAYGKYLVARTKKIMQAIKIIEKDLHNMHEVADKWINQTETYWDKTIALSGIED